MKKLFFLLVLVCCCTSGFSQDLALTIPNMDTKTEVAKMALESADLQSQTYLVKKKKDTYSQGIMEAINSKKTYSEVYIFLKLNDGSRTVNRLTNVYLSDYSKSGSGSSATEQFVVHFEKSQPTH